MPLTAAGSALVGGTTQAQAKDTTMEKTTTRSVRVLRAFTAGGKMHKVDSVIEIDMRFAAEMRNANKVEFVDAAPAKTPAAASAVAAKIKESTS